MSLTQGMWEYMYLCVYVHVYVYIYTSIQGNAF